GLDAEQILVPPEHVLAPGSGALPAIAVVRLANGVTHFVVVWSRLGGRVQVMDPATGRRAVRAADLLRDLFVHEMEVPAASWREYAGTDEFQRPLRARLRALALPEAAAAVLVARANQDPGWRGLAALDAAARLVETLEAPRADRLALLESLFAGAVAG